LCNKNSCADVQICIAKRIQAFRDVLIQIRVTWQGIDYKLPDDDTIVSKRVAV